MDNKAEISFTTLIFIVFLILKLTHVIDWSWWWITCPLWLPFLLAFIILFTLVFLVIIARILKKDPDNTFLNI